MENEIAAHRAGVVTRLSVAPGDAVTTGQVICVVAGRPTTDVSRFCADIAPSHAESLHATASRVDPWILVEYRGLWAHDASTARSRDPVKRICAERVRLPPPALLFVRRPDRRGGDELRVFFARSTASERKLRCVELDVRRPARLDLARAGRCRSTIRSFSSARTASTTAAAPDSAGRSTRRCASRSRRTGCGRRSHIGGDRFAGNLVVLARRLLRARRADGRRPVLDALEAASTSTTTAAAPATASPRRCPGSMRPCSTAKRLPVWTKPLSGALGEGSGSLPAAAVGPAWGAPRRAPTGPLLSREAAPLSRYPLSPSRSASQRAWAWRSS